MEEDRFKAKVSMAKKETRETIKIASMASVIVKPDVFRGGQFFKECLVIILLNVESF